MMADMKYSRFTNRHACVRRERQSSLVAKVTRPWVVFARFPQSLARLATSRPRWRLLLVVVLAIAAVAVYRLRETFGIDLNYVEKDAGDDDKPRRRNGRLRNMTRGAA